MKPLRILRPKAALRACQSKSAPGIDNTHSSTNRGRQNPDRQCATHVGEIVREQCTPKVASAALSGRGAQDERVQVEITHVVEASYLLRSRFPELRRERSTQTSVASKFAYVVSFDRAVEIFKDAQAMKSDRAQANGIRRAFACLAESLRFALWPSEVDKRIQSLTEQIDARGLVVEISQWWGARYRGTRKQLEAEGVIPSKTSWPVGRAKERWEVDDLVFRLERCRPDCMKGPMRLWMVGDYWRLDIDVKDAEQSRQRRWIEDKARALADAVHHQSPEGRREWAVQCRRHQAARCDQAFQDLMSTFVSKAQRAQWRRRLAQ